MRRGWETLDAGARWEEALGDEVAGIEGRLRGRLAVAAGAVAFPLTVSIGLAPLPARRGL